MKLMRLRNLILGVMLGLTVLTSALFTVESYHTQQQTLLRGIDDKLLAAALFTRAMLPADYHDRIDGPAAMSEADYRAIVERYDRLCLDLDLQYVWSVMQYQGKIVFTSGTSTSKDARKGDYARFLEAHTDPHAFDGALRAMQPDYSTFTNKWGRGRMVLVPAKDHHGRVFIFGASMRTSEVDQLLRGSLIRSLQFSFLILLLGAMLSYVLAETLARPIISLTAVAQRLAAGESAPVCPATGSVELASLAESIAHMQTSIQTQIHALQTSREDLRVTLDSIGDGVIATDTEGRVTRINRVAQTLTGWAADEAIGRPLTEVFVITNAHTRAAVENPVDMVLREGAVVGLANDTLLLTRDGLERQIADSAAPIRLSEDEAITGVVLVFRDVTEKYHLEAQVRQAQKMESVGRLAGGIAHDFNNMLCGIAGFASLLGRDLAGQEPLTDYVQHIQEATDRAASLTQKLLSFSRQGRIATAPIDLHRAIEDVLALFERTSDRRITVVTHFDALSSTILGDPSQIQNILLNLCLNARDAMPDGGTLTLTTSNVLLDEHSTRQSAFALTPGHYLRVRVEDTGIGIPEHLREKIFDPFFTTKEVGVGTGLGLAGVYATMKEHHGAVTVYSEPDHGTVFNLLFPVTAATDAPAAPPVPPVVHGTGTILFVDDEEIIRILGKQLLTECGYTVLLAEDGQEAVEIYRRRQQEIDLVILDVVMPRRSGPDAFRAIRSLNPTAKVLISSGYARNMKIDALLAEGLAGFLQKPYDPVALGRLVASTLQGETE